VALHRLLSFAAAVLACTGVLAVCAATAAAQERPPEPPPGLDALWREYPIEPREGTGPAEITPSARPPTADRGAPPPTERADRGGETSPGSGPMTAIVLAAGALTVVAAAIIIVLAAQSAPAVGFRRNVPRRRRPEGGSQMADLFRRIRGGDAPDDEADPWLSPSEANTDHPSSIARTFEPYSLERRTGVAPERHDVASEAPVDVAEGASGAEITSAAQIGEHVTAVLGSAQQAAEKMRREAATEAERIRAEAREEAKSLLAEATREAERMRADAGTYSREARQDADAYAGEKRSEAEAYASRAKAEAEENARSQLEAAKQEAKRIEKDAHRRREVLTSEAERFEERLHSLHAVFQGITTQLEALLPKKPDEPAEEAEQETIEESLRKRVSA
jgi:hypothetical protein